MKGLHDLSFENEAKIRKALVSLSIFTLVISNVQLGGDKLNFFGLEIIVSIEKISAVLRLSILLLLIGLFLMVVERLPRFVAKALRLRDEKWWIKILPDLEAFQNQSRPKTDEEEYHEFRRDNPDWDDMLHSERFERSQRRLKVLGYFRPIALFSRTLTRFVFPIGLAVLALFYAQAILVLG